MATSSKKTIYAPCHKAQIISKWFLEHANEFTILKSQSSRSPVVESEIPILDVQPANLPQLGDAIPCQIWTNI